MLDTIILRYRDLSNVDTIDEHRRLIVRSGYVWWGWWKKDSEPARRAELEEIRAKADASTLLVGLFDRSKQAFFVAKATGCFSSNGPVASPEPHHTPSYYENSKVAAWFKFENIEPVEEKKFEELFGVPPVGSETLFPVSRDRPDAKFALSETIKLTSSKILHISDIHLGGDFDFPDKAGPGATPLIDVIKHDFGDDRPGLVIVSGDLTTRADANVLLEDGLRFFRSLAEQLRLPPECIAIVPGNHDIALKRFKPEDYSHETTFNLFLKEFYGRATTFPGLHKFALPEGRLLELLTMNSVRLRHEAEKNFGYVQWALYEPLLKSVPRDPEGFRLAVLHHHLVAAGREESIDPDYPEAGISLTLDAGAVIDGLQRHGFHVALHGHQHVPAITRVSRGRIPQEREIGELDEQLIVVAAGSAGASRLTDEMRDNSYNVITFDAARLQIEARRYNKATPPNRYFRYRT